MEKLHVPQASLKRIAPTDRDYLLMAPDAVQNNGERIANSARNSCFRRTLPTNCQPNRDNVVACRGIQEKCKGFTRHQNLNRILTFGCYDYGVVMSGRHFGGTTLPLPILTPSRSSRSSLNALYARLAVKRDRRGWPDNYKNLGYKACRMPEPGSRSLNPKRR